MLIDLTGKRFGRLTVISRSDRPGHKVCWNCLCDCGNTSVVEGSSLKNGRIKSCGCWPREESASRAAKQFTKHGSSGTRLYRIWKSMRTRCLNPNSRSWDSYGGRGITICPEWNDYTAFQEWAISSGYRDGLSIDRIDVDGNYCPENCRWATAEEQSNNKRNSRLISINGVTHTLAQWSAIAGINRGTLKSRVESGWSGESLIKPVGR